MSECIESDNDADDDSAKLAAESDFDPIKYME